MNKEEILELFYQYWGFKPKNMADHIKEWHAFKHGVEACEKLYESKLKKYLDKKGV